MGDMAEGIRQISIIIPCYNAAPYIDRCLASIQAQTFGMDKLEIICIDDASTDNTWEYLKKWEQRFPEQILLVHLETNGRQGTARNIGLSYASADWIAFVDADDWLEPDYFERLYEPAANYGCDVAACGYKEDFSDSLTYFQQEQRAGAKNNCYRADTEEETKSWLRYKILGYGPVAKIIRKKLLTDFQLFFPENLVYEDHYWVPLLHIYASHVYVTEEKLYHYFMCPHSTIHSRNTDYHVDWLTVQMIKWTDYHKRGLLEKYPQELAYDFLQDAVGFVKMLILRHDHPSFSLFQLERELIRQQVPDYKYNPYIVDFAEISRIFMEALYLPMNNAEFQQFVHDVKKYYNS